MSLLHRVFELPLAYRVTQAPFAEAKLVPFLRHNDVTKLRRVLDVGCGPGTNTPHFKAADYLGVDINPAYIDYARKKHGRTFEVADVTTYAPPPDARFDCVLANSFLHHVDDANTARILDHLGRLLTPDGHVHILDLVLPHGFRIANAMARLDRGDHPRRLERWKELFSRHFEPVVFEPYPLKLAGRTLWEMVYFKGRVRT